MTLPCIHAAPLVNFQCLEAVTTVGISHCRDSLCVESVDTIYVCGSGHTPSSCPASRSGTRSRGRRSRRRISCDVVHAATAAPFASGGGGLRN